MKFALCIHSILRSEISGSKCRNRKVQPQNAEQSYKSLNQPPPQE